MSQDTKSLKIKEQKSQSLSKVILKRTKQHENKKEHHSLLTAVISLCYHTVPAKIDAITDDDFEESFVGMKKEQRSLKDLTQRSNWLLRNARGKICQVRLGKDLTMKSWTSESC